MLPLHDPVDIAEQIAVADLICGGRLHPVFVAGYARHEFDAFGKSFEARGDLLDDGLEIVTRALSGEPFVHEGRSILVRPVSEGLRSRLLVGGGIRTSALRAARFGAGFWPMKDDLIAVYIDACREHGRRPGPVMSTAIGVHVAEDVENGWEAIGPYALHLLRSYAQISDDASTSNSPMHGLDTMDAVRSSGIVQVLTPDECLGAIRTRPLALVPLIAGLPPELGWQSLRLFAEKVLPRIAS